MFSVLDSLIGSVDWRGETRLHGVIRAGAVDEFSMIMDQIALQTENILLRRTTSGKTYYHHVMYNDPDPRMIDCLFSCHYTDDHFFLEDYEGYTVLEAVIHADIAHALARCYQTALNRVLEYREKDGRNIMHFMAQYGAKKCFVELKRLLPEQTLRDLLNTPDARGNTPIEVARNKFLSGEDGVYFDMMGYYVECFPALHWLAVNTLVKAKKTATELGFVDEEEFTDAQIFQAQRETEAEDRQSEYYSTRPWLPNP